jgi:hypothetical protein
MHFMVIRFYCIHQSYTHKPYSIPLLLLMPKGPCIPEVGIIDLGSVLGISFARVQIS